VRERRRPCPPDVSVGLPNAGSFGRAGGSLPAAARAPSGAGARSQELTIPSAVRFGPSDAALLLVLASMWGLSFLFIEVALTEVPPIWIVAARVSVGATVLLLIVAVLRVPLPRRLATWGHLALLGVMNNAVPWTAVAYAQQALPSGLTALLMAMVPISTLLVSVLVGLERITPLRLVGLLISLGGVGLIVAGDVDDLGRVLAMLVVLGATILYASGAVYAKRKVSGDVPPLALATGQVLVTSVLMIPTAFLVAPMPDLSSLSAAVIGSLAALGALGTGLAFLVFYSLIERVGATNATMVTYLIPVVAVIAGAVVLDERLALTALAGGAVVVLGIWLTQRALPRTPQEAFERVHR
jgi:drug/metabolite transporter (DMT)-like permease